MPEILRNEIDHSKGAYIWIAAVKLFKILGSMFGFLYMD